jgi:hypothetical protein
VNRNKTEVVVATLSCPPGFRVFVLRHSLLQVVGRSCYEYLAGLRILAKGDSINKNKLEKLMHLLRSRLVHLAPDLSRELR